MHSYLVFFQRDVPLPAIPEPFLTPIGGRCGILLSKSEKARIVDAILCAVDWSQAPCRHCFLAADDYAKNHPEFAGKGLVFAPPPPTTLIYKLQFKERPQLVDVTRLIHSAYGAWPDVIYHEETRRAWRMDEKTCCVTAWDIPKECNAEQAIISTFLPSNKSSIWQRPNCVLSEDMLSFYPHFCDKRDQCDAAMSDIPPRKWRASPDYHSISFAITPDQMTPLNNSDKWRYHYFESATAAPHGAAATASRDWLPKDYDPKPIMPKVEPVSKTIVVSVPDSRQFVALEKRIADLEKRIGGIGLGDGNEWTF